MKPPLPIITDFLAAGTLFTNGTHVLAGYQKGYTSPSISGIGGKREGTETYMETALRETVEELFGLSVVPLVLLSRMKGLLEPRRIHKTGSYVLVIYNFNDLEKILELVKRDVKVSPLYKTLPKSISELLLDRTMPVENLPVVNLPVANLPVANLPVANLPEISHLCLLPVMKNCIIDVEFLEDIDIILGATQQSKIESNPVKVEV